METPTRALRRHQANRVIRRRLQMRKRDGFSGDNQPGRFRKWNLTCACWMCKLQRSGVRREDLVAAARLRDEICNG